MDLTTALAGVDNPAPIMTDFAALEASGIAQWRIGVARWTNYYIYESGAIDFSLPGLHGVVSPNCSGKTTIVDVIALGLFNSPRGKRQDAIRVGASRAEMTIEFTVADQQYTLAREDTAARAVVTLTTKNEFGVTEEIGGGQRAVYAALEALIGTRERFMYLTLYDPAYDLFMLSPLERQRALPNILGLALCDQMWEKYSREAKSHAAALAALGPPPAIVDVAALETQRAAIVLGPRPANRWRDAVARAPQSPASPPALPIPCEPEDLRARAWPAKESILAARAGGFAPTAEELAGPAHDGDIQVLFARWQTAAAAATRAGELAARVRYQFNPACACCTTTRGLLAADLETASVAAAALPVARGELAAAFVAELRAERARGPDTLPGKLAYAAAQATAEAAADDAWCQQARTADRLDAAIAVARIDAARAAEYEEAAPRLRAAYTRASVAAKLFKSEEFRTATVAEKLRGVIARANELIAQAGGGFSLDIEFSPEPTFWIVECATARGGFRCEITRGSGYQKFLAGVCCRLALSGFIIIDEGFGVVDPAHMAPLLQMLSGQSAFVLGHTEELARAVGESAVISRGVNGAVAGAPCVVAPARAVPADVLELIAPTVTGSTRSYECICGSSITNTPASISSHNRTTKHRKYMAEQN